MPRRHFIVRKILENVPPNHFIPRPYYLDLLDAVEERNLIICKDENITIQFAMQSLYRDIAFKNPGKCMLVIMPDDSLIEEAAKTFQYAMDVSVFIADLPSIDIPADAEVIFMSAEMAAKLCIGAVPTFSISDRVFFLVLDDCDLVLTLNHPYQALFPSSSGDFTVKDIDEIWNKHPSFYSNVTSYRILGLTSAILPVGCSDHVLAKRYICSLEDRLKCRLETTSELINLLSFGAQPEEEEIPAPTLSEIGADQHPICGTVLRLLEETRDFLSDLDFTGSEENVSTAGQRIINVPFYCLRAVAQCESITKDLGVYCGAIIARVFLRHLYRLERARASTLESRNQLEHGEDLLTRILRYTATQLSMVARLFRVVCDSFYRFEEFFHHILSCMTKEEIRTLASPRVLQLIDHLRTVKPTGSYRIEAVRQTEGISEVDDSDSESDFSGRLTPRSYGSSRSCTSSSRRRRGRRFLSSSSSSSTGFVAPHGFEDGNSSQQSDDDGGSHSSTLSLSDGNSGDENESSMGDKISRSSEIEEDGGESGAESDATDVSMCLSTGLHRKSPTKLKKRSHELRSTSSINRCPRRERIVYRIIAYQPEGVPVIPPLCGLLLVGGCQFSAYALPRFLEDFCNWDSEISFVRPGYFFVPGTPDKLKTIPLSTSVGSSQEETVANFRCGGEVNLLVTTQLGLAAASSLPKCNLVASFHPSTSISSYLLAKSRLRLVAVKTTKSRFWHFLEPDGISLRNRFQEIERMLIQRCNRSYLYADEHDVDPQYVDEAFDFLPKRKASRSIDVVNHYCARLPCNFMTRLAPRWHLISRPLAEIQTELGASTKILSCPDANQLHANSRVAYRCALQMPTNSPVSQVVWGDWSVCKKMAKFSAAVRIGHLLLDAREIDTHGRAVLRHSSIVTATTASRLNRDTRCRSPVKTKSPYLIKTPDSMIRCLPKEDRGHISQNHLYLIEVRHLDSPLSRMQQERRHKGSSSSIDFYPETEDRVFAFLTSKTLPHIPDFSIFTRSGEESVSIYEAKTCPPLNGNQLNRLANFHRIIFKSVLRFEKDTLMNFNLPEAPCQLIIVPVKLGTQEIDWQLVDICLTTYDPSVGDCRMPIRRRLAPPLFITHGPFPLTQLLSLTGAPRTVFDFAAEDFSNAVLTPTYRLVDFPPRYYVVSIRNDLSPASKFPSPQFATFADYYKSKYGLQLSGSPTDQPLLDAAYAPLRLASLLVPRCLAAAQRKPISNGSGIAKNDNSSVSRHGLPRHIQLLVPEFCHRHPLPASVWQKAVCLPSILYRLKYLLLAEELRSEIARETGLGIVNPPSRFCFPALRCYSLPKPSSSRSPSPPPVKEGIQENVDPEVVKLILSPPKGDMKKSSLDLETLLQESGEEFDVDLDDKYGEEFEEEIDAESVDSFEENVEKLCFFPPEDDDTVDDRILYRPGPAMILQSLTLLAAGDFINMERLETIGDSFLKFAVTTHLFFKYPDAHEGNLSSLRSHIVENSNLYRLGCEKQLPGRIVGAAFEPQENWLPPCYACNGDNAIDDSVRVQSSQTHQFLSNKSIADCVEALIGCYLTERGERSALKLLQWFGIECLPPSDEMRSSGAPWKLPEERKLTDIEQAEVDRIYQSCRFEKLEATIGYKFKNRRLLIEALTHSTCRDLHSNPSESAPSSLFSGNGGYERLEFLGDAVLDYAVTRVLFASTDADTARELSPGGLTDLRAALVNNAVFGALAVTRCCLHAHLRATAPFLTQGVAAFVRHNRDVARGDLDAYCLLAPDISAVAENKNAAAQSEAGMTRAANEMEAEVPKALGDVFESLAGAVFLDAGLCLNTLWRIFFPLLRERIERYSTCVAKSPVRLLLEFCPDRVKFERPVIRPDGKMRVAVRVAGAGRFVGVGRTYRLAKSAAADLAYRRVSETNAT